MMVKKASLRYFLLMDIRELSDQGSIFHKEHKLLPKLEVDGLIRKSDSRYGGWVITDLGRAALNEEVRK